MPESHSTVIPALRYADAKAAIEWLCRVLGFARRHVYEAPDGTIAHAELTLGSGMIMLGSQKDDEYGRHFVSPAEAGGRETRSVYLVVSDAEAVWARAQAAGAEIVRPIQKTPYGSREFTVKDPEGHSWSVGTYNPWAAE
ncbi:MAG: VOC family protein [Terracidiphilus sp.]